MGVSDYRPDNPEGAELQHDVRAADWIVESLWPWGRDAGVRTGSLVPEGFDVYVRVFHHAESGRDRIRWAEIAERCGVEMHPLVQFDRFGWPDRPEEGNLRRYEAEALVAVLRDHTTTPGACWLAIWEGFAELRPGGVVGWFTLGKPGLVARLRWWWARHTVHRKPPPSDLDHAPTIELPGRRYFLYRGAIDVVSRFDFMPGWLRAPNIWWPQDRAWCVATEIDFDSTLVGCSRACADTLLASGTLECLTVPLDGRLDIAGDTVNPPNH